MQTRLGIRTISKVDNNAERNEKAIESLPSSNLAAVKEQKPSAKNPNPKPKQQPKRRSKRQLSKKATTTAGQQTLWEALGSKRHPGDTEKDNNKMKKQRVDEEQQVSVTETASDKQTSVVDPDEEASIQARGEVSKRGKSLIQETERGLATESKSQPEDNHDEPTKKTSAEMKRSDKADNNIAKEEANTKVESTEESTSEASEKLAQEKRYATEPVNGDHPEKRARVGNSIEKTSKSVIQSEFEKQRIADETNLLTKLRVALDITLGFHAANNRLVIFHKVQRVLENSTRRNIKLSHIAKILYLVPNLYHLEPKILTLNGANVESYSIEVPKPWTMPWSGKQLEEREKLLSDGIEKYFEEHTEPGATIPEAELPKLQTVVDRKQWLKEAKLPAAVRELLEFHENRKENTSKPVTPRPERTGTVKERREALLERIRAKQRKNQQS